MRKSITANDLLTIEAMLVDETGMKEASFWDAVDEVEVDMISKFEGMESYQYEYTLHEATENLLVKLDRQYCKLYNRAYVIYYYSRHIKMSTFEELGINETIRKVYEKNSFETLIKRSTKFRLYSHYDDYSNSDLKKIVKLIKPENDFNFGSHLTIVRIGTLGKDYFDVVDENRVKPLRNTKYTPITPLQCGLLADVMYRVAVQLGKPSYEHVSKMFNSYFSK